ncbi:efflux RND transporter permease subunit [Leptospira bandrabouensis]|uniref:efflux RND transporter permease subunit n=1 Tax=Leptospira bandrabouensis TaxID=2484903 RepID=UPI00223C9A09|nr:efflux RND transporter permease subunit [Leptospira bandrabouensis]MCW7459194.1 efflux RND transporter permease subunit [Leptospira bandrabouensis]MCW7477729.1 efflux RND transporter permease subunit [Leptospira bandrabouensis]MCW7485411.1 efflux RND transporter permease subunit [Leptospira bandrabouensis]
MGSSIVQYFLSKSLFVNLLTFLIILVGGFTAATMNREAFPNINFDIVSVTTIYPGAAPADVEKLVTKPLEDAIKEVDGIKEFRSASLENRSGIIVTIDPNTKNTQKVVDDLKSAIDRIQDLPEDVDDPIVTEITTARQPVIEIHLSSTTKDGKPLLNAKELRDQAKILEEKLKDLPSVARITKRGWREREMKVDLDPDKLRALSLSSTQVINALRLRNINFPGGNINEKTREIIVRTVGEFDTAEEIENVFVRSNDAGRSVRIRDVARVTEGFEDSEYLDKSNGDIAIALTVIKREKADAITVVDDSKKVVEEFIKSTGGTVKHAFVNDLSKYIRRRLGVLTSNAVSGLFLVTASLFVFLGWRMALMTALGIPISIAMTFVAMNYMGLTLNLISMMGLIIVVGILVDDAIIICENVYRHLEMGEEPFEAAMRGTSEVLAPVTATVTTTIAAFGPMLFMTGIFGKFIHSIPLVVILSLCSSLFEAFFMLPSHLYDVSKASDMKGEVKEESHWFIKFKEKTYLPLLSFALKNRWKMVGLLMGLFVFSLAIQVKFGKFKLFPGAIETFQVRVTAETGLKLEETDRFIRAIENAVGKLPEGEVENYISRVGIIQKDPNDPFTKRGKNYAQVMVYLTPDDNRERSTEEIIEVVRQNTKFMLNEKALQLLEEKLAKENLGKNEENPLPTSEIPKEYIPLKGKLVNLEFEKLAGGPPVGKPVAIEIKGDDFATLLKIGAEYKAALAKINGVTDIGDDFNEGKDEIRVSVDETLASFAGVSVQSVSLAINTALQGTVSTKIKRADEEVDVRVRFPEEYRSSLTHLNKVYVNNLTGNLIPVSRLTSYDRNPGRASINHLDGKRLLTVTSNIDETISTSRQVNMEAKKLTEGIIAKYPGYSVRFSGENKDTEESMASLGRAFLVGLLIIYMILASLFRSLAQPLIVMSAIPFAVIGVIFAFLIHGQPFSFLAFLGIIGLAGVVVNDSIVLVDCANQLRIEDPSKSTFELLVEAGSIRLRAVMLTTVTTVLGLLPTAYGIGGKDPFLVPMALAFGWGLAFATFITLIMVPVFYLNLYMFKDWVVTKFQSRQSRKKGYV